MTVEIFPAGAGLGSFHVHPGHVFEGFELRHRRLVSLYGCGETLDVADAVQALCPECRGAAADCLRCAGTGDVVDHAALEWHLPTTA